MKTILLTLSFLFWGFSLCAQQEKPLIGISCSHSDGYSTVRRTYTESVLLSGGLPVLIPITENEEALDELLTRIDALILIGGADINPSYYGEDPIEQLGEVDSLRDVYDLALIHRAAVRKLPILGICRGEQLINVAFGGTLYQDIPTQHPDTTVHHQQDLPNSVPTHTVTLLPESVIAQVTGQTQLFTNSHHHQAVKQVAPGFRVTGWATDGIPEVIEPTNGQHIWGVQFHPEGLTVAGDSIMEKIFTFFVQQATLYQESSKKP